MISEGFKAQEVFTEKFLVQWVGKLSGQLQKVHKAMDILWGPGSAQTPIQSFWRGCDWAPTGSPWPLEGPASPQGLPAYL